MTALAIACFATAERFRAAICEARMADRAIAGLWSPLPVDLADDGGGAERGVAWIMAAAGCAGAALFYLMIWWSATIAYPFNSGGRPLNNWSTFLISPIELGALVAGAAGVVMFFLRARLTRLHDAAFEIEEVGAAARDRFVVAIRCDEGDDANRLIAMLGAAGAVHSRIVAG